MQVDHEHNWVSGGVEASIRSILNEALSPLQLEIENQSSRHSHHASSPETGESHFEVHIVSNAFTNLNALQRQRLVYGLLKDQLAGPIHALSLKCKSPDEIVN